MYSDGPLRMIQLDSNVYETDGNSLNSEFSSMNQERMNNMSYCCLLKSKNGVVLCGDTREAFVDGTHNENRQKIFVTNDKKVIYGCTGIIKYKDIDYVKTINSIMNDSRYLSLQEKLDSIADLMKSVTRNHHLQNENGSSKFDMFIIDLYQDYVLTTLSVENGEYISTKYSSANIPLIAMGKQTFLINTVVADKIKNYTLSKLIEVGRILVNKAAILEKEETYPTINNKMQWISVDKDGFIKGIINL